MLNHKYLEIKYFIIINYISL